MVVVVVGGIVAAVGVGDGVAVGVGCGVGVCCLWYVLLIKLSPIEGQTLDQNGCRGAGCMQEKVVVGWWPLCGRAHQINFSNEIN